MDKFKANIESFVRKLTRKIQHGERDPLSTTVDYLKQLVSSTSFDSDEEIKKLLSRVTYIGRIISQKIPLAISLANIVRRVLNIIRSECKQTGLDVSEDQTSAGSIFKLRRVKTLTELLKGDDKVPPTISYNQLRNDILNSIDELSEEVDSHLERISDHAPQYIQPRDVILIYGKSQTVFKFLVEARAHKNFEVIVAEAAPHCRGHLMAKMLSEANIKTYLISDNSIFALMNRVNKVLVGAQALMANGGLITASGIYGVCLAAQVHSVPVLVTCGLHKLCPLYPFDQDTFNETLSPGLIAELPAYETADLITFSVPALDYIPPELISLYVTDAGVHNSTYLYRLLSEYYSPEDYNLIIK